MPDRDRDQSVEHVLRRVLSDSRSVLPPSACIDGEILAAWNSGSLPAEQAAAVERHVADCARCQAMMAAFVQMEPVAQTSESVWRRWRLGWLVPLATAATAAALWIALPGNSALPTPVDTASRSAVLEPQSPTADAVQSPSPTAAARSEAPPPALAQERFDARAGNEARKQLEESLSRQRAEDQLAGAGAGAPPPPAAAAPAESAEADRRELAANATARTFAARVSAVLPEIVAPGGAARWRIVNGRQVERSTSAGAEWMPVTIDPPDLLIAGAATSPSVCWIVGRRGAVYLTTDGSRFVRLPFPEPADLVSVAASDDRTATVSSLDGRSWQTADQGRTWSVLP